MDLGPPPQPVQTDPEKDNGSEMNTDRECLCSLIYFLQMDAKSVKYICNLFSSDGCAKRKVRDASVWGGRGSKYDRVTMAMSQNFTKILWT